MATSSESHLPNKPTSINWQEVNTEVEWLNPMYIYTRKKKIHLNLCYRARILQKVIMAHHIIPRKLIQDHHSLDYTKKIMKYLVDGSFFEIFTQKRVFFSEVVLKWCRCTAHSVGKLIATQSPKCKWQLLHIQCLYKEI